jgi:hypothetical protein
MITLPSHSSHVLQPLDVNYFKPFKSALRKQRDERMFRNNHKELDKVTLACWVNRTFNQSFFKQNVKAMFKTTRIWFFNPRAMDNQSRPNELYTSKSNLDISNDEDGQLKGIVDGSQWGKDKIATKVINIITVGTIFGVIF